MYFTVEKERLNQRVLDIDSFPYYLMEPTMFVSNEQEEVMHIRTRNDSNYQGPIVLIHELCGNLLNIS